MLNAEQLLYATKKKQPVEVFYKDVVFKNFVIFVGKHQCEILKNTYFEDLRTVDSQLTL